jgi:hypothetical protein
VFPPPTITISVLSMAAIGSSTLWIPVTLTAMGAITAATLAVIIPGLRHASEGDEYRLTAAFDLTGISGRACSSQAFPGSVELLSNSSSIFSSCFKNIIEAEIQHRPHTALIWRMMWVSGMLFTSPTKLLDNESYNPGFFSPTR